MSDTATTHRREADGRPGFRPGETVRPAAAAAEACRSHRLDAEEPVSGALNIALTLICALLIDGSRRRWSNSCSSTRYGPAMSREDCLATTDIPRSAPAGPSSSSSVGYFVYGFYPIGARWRVDMFFALLAVGVAWMVWLDAPRRDIGAAYFFIVMPMPRSSCCAACR